MNKSVLSSARAVALFVAAGVLGSDHAVAQCLPQFSSNGPVAGIDGNVEVARMWDPDGAGPLAPRLVVGGTIRLAGSTPVRNLAMYDPATGAWSGIGGGVNGVVGALDVLPGGQLVVAGLFSVAGSIAASNIAIWNGATWSALGSGTNNFVTDLAVAPNGELFVGGSFTFAGGVQALNVARWNGSWSNLATGPGGPVRTLSILPSGNLVAGGSFSGNLLVWNGSGWNSFPVATPNGTVNASLVLPNGDLVIGGSFLAVGAQTVQYVARWNGATWSSFGAGLSSAVYSLSQLAGGQVAAANENASGFSVWNGSAWVRDGASLFNIVSAVVDLPGGDLVVAGSFVAGGGVNARSIARKSAGAWSSLNPGTNARILAVAALPSGGYVVGGEFTAIAGVPANRVAVWDGVAWSALGAGVNGAVSAIAVMPNGDIVVGGSFAAAGGVPAARVARWNGSAWSDVGGGFFGSSVEALHVMPGGDLVAGGWFSMAGSVIAHGIARWDGSAWSPLGSGMNAGVLALASLSNGDLVAGGSFTTAGGVAANRIARYTSGAWSPFDTGFNNSVFDVHVVPQAGPGGSDILYAAGDFGGGSSSIQRIAQWSGSVWFGLNSSSPLGRVRALASLPNGDLIVGGEFQTLGFTPGPWLARFHAATFSWSPLGTGMNAAVFAIAGEASREYAIVGEFSTAGGAPSMAFTRFATPCPASATPVGTACASSGGANAYAALNLPYAGATYRTRGTGLPSFAFVAVVNGFAGTAIPLGAVLAPSPAGCTLLVTPDVVDVTLSNAGTVDAQLALPNTPSIAGIVLHQQLVALEVDASLNFVQNTSTNGLMATVGAF